MKGNREAEKIGYVILCLGRTSFCVVAHSSHPILLTTTS
jgi:hypothetical protein